MPPKTKDFGNKKALQLSQIRPAISTHSLNEIPDGIVEGFQERIETGIEWTDIEKAARQHKSKCINDDVLTYTFSEALKQKIDDSVFSGFFNDDCTISLQDNYEYMLPTTLWDQDKFATEEEKLCFYSKNNITDNMEQIIKKAVMLGDRNVLRNELKSVSNLRLNNAGITLIDDALKEYQHLVNLVLCGNYIKCIDGGFLPQNVKMLEFQANGIKNIESFGKHFAREVYYLGLARNLFNDESIACFIYLPYNLVVLDLGDNDIYNLNALLEILKQLVALRSLTLAGNPCSVCTAYALVVLQTLPLIEWLDNREVVPTEDPLLLSKSKQQHQQHAPMEVDPDDLRCAYFFFKVLRILSVPPPPKAEKGAVGNFSVEVEIPLLDSKRRHFLMFHDNEYLIEDLPEPEGGWQEIEIEVEIPKPTKQTNVVNSAAAEEEQSHAFDLYKNLDTKFSRQILHYTIFESNKIQWNNAMNFQEPAVSIFCPDLVALRDTFRSVITVRLVYTLSAATKSSKDKNHQQPKHPDQRVILATVQCPLRRLDWSQSAQHFHWDDSLGTDYAIHWGNGDLEALQYTQGLKSRTNVFKQSKNQSPDTILKRPLPDNMTCHFAFGIITKDIL